MRKTLARSLLLFLIGYALLGLTVALWFIIAAKAAYEPTNPYQFIPVNRLIWALYQACPTPFDLIWPHLPDGSGVNVFLSGPSASVLALMLVDAGILQLARIGVADVRKAHAERRQERLRGSASRILNAIEHVAAGGDVHIVQGNGNSTSNRKHEPSETLGTKMLLGVLIPVCVAAILVALGLRP